PVVDARMVQDLGGAEGTGGAACVEILPGCETGEGTCAGIYARTCNADGTAYVYEYCFPKTCKNGACVPAACGSPGGTHCIDTQSGIKCKEDLSVQMPFECDDNTVCAGGVCFPLPCTSDDVRCAGQGGFVTCAEAGDAWVFSSCLGEEFCDLDADNYCSPIQPHCVLEPLGAFCQDAETAMQCTIGPLLQSTHCGLDEVCVDGFCQPGVCGVIYDASYGRGIIAPDVAGGPGDGVDTYLIWSQLRPTPPLRRSCSRRSCRRRPCRLITRPSGPWQRPG
ncbi:MAG: hypothetical protein ABIK09_15105, partial [Pseudomonadota bacterium]